MKNKISCLVGILLFVSACKTDPSTNPSEPISRISIIVTDSDSTVIAYNQDKTVKSYEKFFPFPGITDSGYIDLLQYENKRLQSVSSVSKDKTVARKDAHVLSYNNKGYVTRVTQTSFDRPVAYDSLVYDNKGQVIEWHQRSIPDNGEHLSWKFTWENGNIIKTVDAGGIRTHTTTYTYDKTRNAFAVLKFRFYLQSLFHTYLSANNVIEEKVDFTPYNEVSTYQYEYNSKNYPVKSIRTAVVKKVPTDLIYTYKTRMTYLPD